MSVNEIRARVPVELSRYKELLEVGVRHLAACESLPKLRRGESVKQSRFKLSDSALATVRMLAGRPGWSESSVVWAALIMAARCRLNVENHDAPHERRAGDKTGTSHEAQPAALPSGLPDELVA